MARSAAASLCVAMVLGTTGCFGTAANRYAPDELRRELASRKVPSRDLVVLHELPPEALARADELVLHLTSNDLKVQALVRAMFDREQFGLRYDESATTTAAEALRARRGNCVALAAVFVGLVRAIGLEARYIDVSNRVHETRYGEAGSTVRFGHVTAMVDTGLERISLDFARFGPVKWYRVLDDLEAHAHYYNNRGYDFLDPAGEEPPAPDWPEAERQFRLATLVKPSFARAWNNLGIAVARQGRTGEAVGHYRRAAELDPRMAAPHANLGAAFLQRGEVAAALEELAAAAQLDPGGAHIQFNLAVARLRSGDRDGAVTALHRTLKLSASYPGAVELLERLTPGSPGAGGE
ncbi:MAG: tetratricopeptide repeat protein [Anaeromyxobacteraceae bacterium]|nr:tetratricopeptide repeat protein [Anaeromyxobacteraceae bacterium]